MTTRLLLIVLCLTCAGVAGAQDVASTSKSAVQEHKEYFDKKNTVLKLYYEFYDLKKFDKDDKLISTEEVKHGFYLEWNQTGKQKRSLRSKPKLPEGYFKLLESYEDGRLSGRTTFHASGKPQEDTKFDDDGLPAEREIWADADGDADGKTVLKERLQKGVTTQKEIWEYLSDGKLKCREKSNKHGVEEREDFEYAKDGSVKSRKFVMNIYDYKGELTDTKSNQTLVSDKGVQTSYVDEVKRSEGKIVDASKNPLTKDPKKDGEWKYWDAASKLVKVETWDKGALKETKEFK